MATCIGQQARLHQVQGLMPCIFIFPAFDRPDTEEEEALRAQLSELRAALQSGEDAQKTEANPTSLQEASLAEHHDDAAHDTPQINGMSEKPENNGSDGDGGDAAQAQPVQQQQDIADKIEQLEGELSKMVVANDDRVRYARSNSSSRW